MNSVESSTRDVFHRPRPHDLETATAGFTELLRTLPDPDLADLRLDAAWTDATGVRGVRLVLAAQPLEGFFTLERSPPRAHVFYRGLAFAPAIRDLGGRKRDEAALEHRVRRAWFVAWVLLASTALAVSVRVFIPAPFTVAWMLNFLLAILPFQVGWFALFVWAFGDRAFAVGGFMARPPWREPPGFVADAFEAWRERRLRASSHHRSRADLT